MIILLSLWLICSATTGSASTDSIVTPQWLQENFDKVRLIDASYTPGGEHIPGAVFFDLTYAFYPSKFIIYDLYPPEIFQKYIRLLGVNKEDHVVVYSGGMASGMMFSSRAYWTFKVYGFENVSLLNGGLEGWKAAGGATDHEIVKPALGNFVAKPFNSSLLALFEEIPFNQFAAKNDVYLDARVTLQFTGQLPLKTIFPGTTATGSHVTGAINFPIAEVIGPNGFLSKEQVDAAIAKLGLKGKRQVYVACNVGIQATVIFAALERSGVTVKVHNGSMNEMAYRAPALVNAKGP